MLWATGQVLSVLSKAPRSAQAFSRHSSAHTQHSQRAAICVSPHVSDGCALVAARQRYAWSAARAARRLGAGAASRPFGSVWWLTVPAAAPCTGDIQIDWDDTPAHQLVLDARLAERDEVPAWARAMVLRGQQVHLRFFKGGKQLPQYLLSDAFELTKANMEKMYVESIWGWSDEQKRADLESPLARFFVATDERGQLQGFVHYRFEVIDNKFTHRTSAAAYVLELQIVDTARRLGLGTLLMKAVEEIADRAKMDSSMLCVFRCNEPAVNFYLNRMGYRIDQSSSFNENQRDVWELVKPNPTRVPDAPVPSHLQSHSLVQSKAKNTQQTEPPQGSLQRGGGRRQ